MSACARRRLQAHQNERWLEDKDLARGGLMWADPRPDKFQRVYRLLDTLDGLVAGADWSSGAEVGAPLVGAQGRRGEEQKRDKEEDDDGEAEEKSAAESILIAQA